MRNTPKNRAELKKRNKVENEHVRRNKESYERLKESIKQTGNEK